MKKEEKSGERIKCPDCDGPMVSRANRQTGERFWGCKSFPQCKGTRDSMGRSKAERDLEREEDDLNAENELAADNDKFRFNKS